MMTDFSQFHFIRPEWLFALPVVVALWWFVRKASAHQQWQDYFPQAMLQALQVDGHQRSSIWHWWLLTSWLLLSLAMAGPTWIKQAVPLVKNQKALALLLDLSPSMLAEDLTPNRLTRAKYKLIDILEKQEDGQVALIAYAGDAHTVSPLTDDPRTIESLLPALHPNIMPSRGSNIEAAIELAQSLLTDAGVSSGEILVLTDGIAPDAMDEIEAQLSNAHRLSILGVGSNEAAPVKLADGGFLRNRSGDIVLASVNHNELQGLANTLGGRFANLSSDESDINYLLKSGFESGEADDSLTSNSSFDAWKDLGHWLVLLVLPIALLCFRKGLIYLVPIIVLSPIDSQAQEISLWNKLWKTPDQQAVELLNNEQYDKAANTFENKDWSAVANYKNGDFAEAAKQFSSNGGNLSNTYNQANALALSGEFEQAIEAYEKVLEQQADHEDALHNKKIIEALLEQQKQQEQQQGEGDQNQENQDGEQSEQKNSDQQQSQDGESSESQDSSQEQQDSPSEGEEPSASEEPSAGEESSANQEPSADEESSTNEQSSEEQQSASEEQGEEEQSEQQASSDEATDGEESEEEQQAQTNEASDEEQGEEGEAQSAEAVVVEQTPLKDSSEQWLRTIQDDPSGLLRRKFKYQSGQRTQQNNNSQQDRY